jgi:hypothetical protein
MGVWLQNEAEFCRTPVQTNAEIPGPFANRLLQNAPILQHKNGSPDSRSSEFR